MSDIAELVEEYLANVSVEDIVEVDAGDSTGENAVERATLQFAFGSNYSHIVEACRGLLPIINAEDSDPARARYVHLSESLEGIDWDVAEVVLSDNDLFNFEYSTVCIGETTVGYELQALAARHLTKANSDWDQDTYDKLTLPYRTVIGRLHPDDADLFDTAQ